MRTAELTSESPDVTRELGGQLGRALLAASREQPIVIYLSGELGAGKTTFVNGLMRALGVSGPIRSPTYTLIEPYELDPNELDPIAVYHMDLYRLSDARDLEMLALRDLLRPGAVLLVEWAERGAGALPAADLAVGLSYPDTANAQIDRRVLQLEANTKTGELLLNKLVTRSS
jgi:tRNA threonylcarbamoyladenosine biosynthesis protein TsaE